MKQVRISPYRKKLYFHIIEYVKEFNKLPTIRSFKFPTPKSWKKDNFKQNLSYYVKKLKEDKILLRIAYAEWAIDKDKLKQKQVRISPRASTTPLNIGGHGLIVTWRLPTIQNWNQKNIISFLNKRHIKHIPVGFNGLTRRIIHKGHKVWLARKSITIYMPKGVRFYESSAKDARLQAMRSLLGVLHSLENLFATKFKFANGYQFKVNRQHYAKVKDDLAQFYNSQGKKLLVSDSNGTWLIIDDSLKDGGELEATNKKSAVGDMDLVVKPHLDDISSTPEYFNDLKDYVEKTGDNPTPSKMMAMINGLFQNQKETKDILQANIQASETLKGYQAQIKLHLEVEKRQLEVQNKLNKAIGELRKELRRK